MRCSEGDINPLVALQHGAAYQQNLCRLMELVVGPMVQTMQARCAQNNLQPQLAQMASLQQFAPQRAHHTPQHAQHAHPTGLLASREDSAAQLQFARPPQHAPQRAQHAQPVGTLAPREDSAAQLTQSMADLLSDSPGGWMLCVCMRVHGCMY